MFWTSCARGIAAAVKPPAPVVRHKPDQRAPGAANGPASAARSSTARRHPAHQPGARPAIAKKALEALAALGGRLLQPGNATWRRAGGATRGAGTATLLAILTGAEDAVAVNNNAAAVLLVLVALAHGKEAVVSRGELVQIGGGFRVPEMMEQSGANAERGGYHQPDLPRGLRKGDRRQDSAHPARCTAPTSCRRASSARPRIGELAGVGQQAQPAAGLRPGQRRPAGHGGLRAGARAHRAGNAAQTGRTWCVFRATSCWAGRRPASSPGKKSLIKPLLKPPADARHTAGQALGRRAGSHGQELPG